MPLSASRQPPRQAIEDKMQADSRSAMNWIAPMIRKHAA
jgi:hypothetical protein